MATVDAQLEVDTAQTGSFEPVQSDGLQEAVMHSGCAHGVKDRTHHGLSKQVCFLPTDAGDQNRLDLQHEMCKLILDGRHGLAPINAPEHIVDIATGTGIWAVDFAKQHPQSTVVGIDLSEFGTLSAPNVTFLQQDAEKDAWEFAQQFDYVHMRFVVTCFTDMRTVLRKALDNIKPGGWIEIHDVLGIPEFFDDGAPAPALERWCALCQTAAANIGRDFKKPLKYKSWLREVGFVDVEQRIFKSPGNTWPSNPKLKKIGALQLQSLSGAMEGLRGGFLAAAGVSNDKADDLLAKALEEMRNTNCHFWWPVYIVYGRKPGGEGRL